VLRKDGTCWVNLGDSYSGGGRGWQGKNNYKNLNEKGIKNIRTDIPNKSLVLIPQRFAIEMVNRGWILRNTIIWHKPNCMPSSAKDRFTVDFEYVYFFTKSNKAQFWTNSKTGECISKKPLGTKGIEGKDWEWQKKESSWQRPSRKEGYKKVSLWTGHDYWFEQQFEELDYDSFRETKRGRNQPKSKLGDLMSASVNARESLDNWKINPNGRNKRTVWTIPTQPFPEAHFAVYPEKLIEPMIKAGCPRYVCKKCGKARVKILDYSDKVNAQWGKRKSNPQKFRDKREIPQKIIKNVNVKEIGYTDCGCHAGFEGGIVLDPFMGAGTTAVVAKKLGRNYLGIEIKQEYIDMANKRIRVTSEPLF